MKTCSVCGRKVNVTVACPYQRRGLETCPDCCEKCYQTTPFPCREHDQRKAAEPKTWDAAAAKLAGALDLPEDQAIPCLIAYACTRYYGKDFARRLAEKNRISAIQAVLIGVALFRLSRAQKKDPFGTMYGITKFAESWRGQVRKEGEEEK